MVQKTRIVVECKLGENGNKMLRTFHSYEKFSIVPPQNVIYNLGQVSLPARRGLGVHAGTMVSSGDHNASGSRRGNDVGKGSPRKGSCSEHTPLPYYIG